MESFKSGFVTIIGRTNVGKSSIINSLVGEKVSAIANKPQTTRKNVKAIINRENSQIIIIDTPGIHKPKSKLGNIMVESAIGSIPDVDIVVYVIDAENPRVDEATLDKIRQANKKTILVINKIELINAEKLAKIINEYKELYDFIAIIPVSVRQNKNVEEIAKEIEKNLKEGPAYYDIEEYTDQTLRQLAEETIREKILKFLQDEVPHGVFVEVQKMKERTNKNGEEIYDIEANIYCMRESHKGIIIGKNGEMLKKIGRAARIDMEQNFGLKVNLKTWVKVKENWIDNPSIVSKFKLK